MANRQQVNLSEKQFELERMKFLENTRSDQLEALMTLKMTDSKNDMSKLILIIGAGLIVLVLLSGSTVKKYWTN